MQMYESEETGEILEEELASIFEIMLGVEDVELTVLFLSLEDPDKDKITYGKTRCLFVTTVIVNAAALFKHECENVKLIIHGTYEIMVEMIDSF